METVTASVPLDDLKSDWRYIAVGGVFGAIFSVCFYLWLFNYYRAVTIVQMGSLSQSVNTSADSTGSTSSNKNAQLVSSINSRIVEKSKTMEFARRVAGQMGDPSLASQLPAREYGGTGRPRLEVQPMVDGTLVRVIGLGPSKQNAIDIARTAAQLMIEDDKALLQSSQNQTKSSLAVLKKNKAQTAKLVEKLSKSLGNVNDPSRAGSLLLALTTQQDRLSKLSDEITSLKATEIADSSQLPAIFSAPLIVRPVISSWWLAALAGLLGGLVIGYVLGMAFRRG